jgi:hypothetical protein
MPRSHRSPLVPAIIAAILAVVLAAVIFGCDESTPPEPVNPVVPLATWTAPADVDQDKLDNLIRSGLVGEINHNHGTVKVNAAKWAKLSPVDRDEVIRLVSTELGRMPQVEVMP